MSERQCCQCRDGEHENLSDVVDLVTVRDPEENTLVMRGYVCGEHQNAFLDDGYEVIHKHWKRP